MRRDRRRGTAVHSFWCCVRTVVCASALSAPVVRSATTLGPDPVWREAAAPARVVVRAEALRRGSVRASRTLVSVPDGVKVARGLTKSGRLVPVRVLAGEGGRSAVLVDSSRIRGEDFCVYLGVGDDGGTLRDSRPVAMQASKATGQDAAESWDAFRFLLWRRGVRVRRTLVAGFGGEGGNTRLDWRGSGWSRNGFLIERQSWVMVPERCRARFAVDGKDATFLVVDGRLAAERPGEHAAGQWGLGQEMELEAGLHRIVAFNISRRQTALRVGWSIDGGAVKQIGVEQLVTGAEMVSGRLERANAVVHAGAKVSVGAPYAFGEGGEALVALTLQDNSRDWLGGEWVTEWFVDGVSRGIGERVEAIVEAGLAHEVTSQVVSDLGFSSAVSVGVAARLEKADRYGLSGRLRGVPAICYEADRVWPSVELRADTPPDIEFDVSATIAMVDGRREVRSGRFAVERSWGQLALPAVTAGDVAEVDWQVAYGGVGLASGRVVFARAPYKEVPREARGDVLLDSRDEQTVLVLEPYATLPPVQWAYRGVYPVALLDASLGTPIFFKGAEEARFDGRLSALMKRDRDDFMHIDASWLQDKGDVQQSLGRVAELASSFGRYPGIVVIAFGGEALVNRQPAGLFERELAALCALLTGPGEVDVVLVTPPPYEGYEEASRKFAQCVQRVADAQGVGVADVFTAFRTFEGQLDPLVSGFEVTDAGQALAAQVLARTLSRITEGGAHE